MDSVLFLKTTGRVSSFQTEQFVANLLIFSLAEINVSEPVVNKSPRPIPVGGLKIR